MRLLRTFLISMARLVAYPIGGILLGWLLGYLLGSDSSRRDREQGQGFLMWLGFAIGVYIGMAVGLYQILKFAILSLGDSLTRLRTARKRPG